MKTNLSYKTFYIRKDLGTIIYKIKTMGFFYCNRYNLYMIVAQIHMFDCKR